MERETFVRDNVLIRCVGGVMERRTGEGRNEGQEERAWKGKHLVEMFPSLGNDEREGGWSPWYSKMAVTSDRHGHNSPRQVTLLWSKILLHY